MPKSSKQLSTSSANKKLTVLHSSPLGKATNIFGKIPTFNKKLLDYDLVIDSSNAEITSPSSQETKVFTIETGLKDTEPTFIVSSEFIPLYGPFERSEQGNALLLKENAKILNAKVSVELLNQSEDVKLAVSSSKENLKDYIRSENSFLTQLMRLVNSAHESMNISAYVIPKFGSTDSDSEPMGSLYEILKKGGYSSRNIVNFSETKMWQQSLLELKKSLLTHTPSLVSQNMDRNNISNDSDPYLISDVEGAPKNTKRIWLNLYYNDLPEEKDLYKFDMIDSNITKMLDFSDKQYVNLAFSYSVGNKRDVEFFSESILKPYEESGRDVSIISNFLFKEASYSSFMTDRQKTSDLTSRYGYVPSETGDNFQVWDHIVGRFPKSVLDTVREPTGDKNSLVSFSQEYIQGENGAHFNVLTLEDNYVENSDITPGSFYYIDSSLNTSNGVTFDLTRLDKLIDKTQTAREATHTVLDVMGYDVSRRNQTVSYTETYNKRNTDNLLTLDGLIQKLSIVGTTYQKYLYIADPQYPSITGFNYQVMREANSSESIGIRLASLVCKAASSPKLGYTAIGSRLKTTLFLWLMNQTFAPDGNEKSRLDKELKGRIVSLLTSVNVGIDPKNLFGETLSATTFPFAIGNISKRKLDNVDVTEESRSIDARANAQYNFANLENEYRDAVKERVFNLSAGTGLWVTITDILKFAYSSPSLYVNGKTAYSGVQRLAYAYSYFDLALKIISLQVPQDLMGAYSVEYTRSATNRYTTTTYSQEEITDRSFDATQSIIVTEQGLITTSNVGIDLNSFYNAPRILKNQPLSRVLRKLSDIISFYEAEEKLITKQVSVYRRYLFDLGVTAGALRDFLDRNFQQHLNRVKTLFDQDGSLSEKQKLSLLNMTLTDEQVKMTRYTMSEISDRISRSSDTESKLRSIPAFGNFPEKFTDLLPVNETDLVSYTMLSPYFKNNNFLPKEGVNKRVLSVGIPAKLNRRIRSVTRLAGEGTAGASQGLVRVRLFRIDRLHPDLVFEPKTYLFDMNRFPTRVISNWDFESFYNSDFNLLRLPSKVVLPNGEIRLHKNYSEAFPESIYGNFLADWQKLEIYANHSISFLSEEYLRWFTDCKFDETRYINYSQLTNTLENVETQYNRYLSLVRESSLTDSLQTGDTGSNFVAAQFFDPVSGQSFQIPVNKPKFLSRTTTLRNANEAQKTYVIPMDKSIRTYFANETLMSDTNLYRRRITYPKKFDRVFTIIVDPDDFVIDNSITSEETLNTLKELGVVTGGYNDNNELENPFKLRNTGLGDVSMDEYFVTVEPFDYTQEYEG
jgi:hypothetical protein